MYTCDGWTKLISNIQPPMKAAPQQCPQKAHFKFSRVWRYSSVRRLSSEERLAKLSRLSPSSLTYVQATAKIENDSWRSATIGKVVSLFAEQFAERVATCNVGRNWIWISRDPAKASRPRDLKIDSGRKAFPLKGPISWLDIFRCPQALSASVTKQPFLARMGLVRG